MKVFWQIMLALAIAQDTDEILSRPTARQDVADLQWKVLETFGQLLTVRELQRIGAHVPAT